MISCRLLAAMVSLFRVRSLSAELAVLGVVVAAEEVLAQALVRASALSSIDGPFSMSSSSP